MTAGIARVGSGAVSKVPGKIAIGSAVIPAGAINGKISKTYWC